MILDLQKAALPSDLRCEIAIVGSGAAGITLALALAEAGTDILLIEAGGDKPHPLVQSDFASSEVSPATHHTADSFRRRAFGGTTSLWGGRCIPLDPIDFEARAWVPRSGWPIGFADLQPYIAAATEICEAGPPAYDAAAGLPGTPSPLVDATPSGDLILDRIERFSPPTHFARRYRDRLARANVRVLLNAPVVDILLNPSGTAVAGVKAADPGGRHDVIACTRVVLAAGGLETARLLLAARSVRPQGLGNARDLVGRCYQTHVEASFPRIEFLKPARIDYQRAPNGVYCRRYIQLSRTAQRRERVMQMVLRPHLPDIADPGHRSAILSGMYFAKSGLVPEYARILTGAGGGAAPGIARGRVAGHVRNVVLGSPALAAFAVKWMRRRVLAARKLPSVVLLDPRGRYPLNLNAEQSPNPDSRVMLGADRDRHDMPRLKIDWRLASGDRAMIATGLRTMRDAFAAGEGARLVVGDGDIEQIVASLTPIGHHLGTARMGSDAAAGVCDRNGEVFDTPGLYVCGGALFPTSGFANPTLTIVALALRMADHLGAKAGSAAGKRPGG